MSIIVFGILFPLCVSQQTISFRWEWFPVLEVDQGFFIQAVHVGGLGEHFDVNFGVAILHDSPEIGLHDGVLLCPPRDLHNENDLRSGRKNSRSNTYIIEIRKCVAGGGCASVGSTNVEGENLHAENIDISRA